MNVIDHAEWAANVGGIHKLAGYIRKMSAHDMQRTHNMMKRALAWIQRSPNASQLHRQTKKKYRERESVQNAILQSTQLTKARHSIIATTRPAFSTTKTMNSHTKESEKKNRNRHAMKSKSTNYTEKTFHS